MSKATRMLAVSGAALFAGATIGAGPAMASTSTAPATTASTQSTGTVVEGQAGERVMGYYRTRRSCERAGRIGEWRGRWDDSDCDRVRWGHRRGWWVLTVDWDWNNNNDNNNNNNDDNDWNHRHRGHR